MTKNSISGNFFFSEKKILGEKKVLGDLKIKRSASLKIKKKKNSDKRGRNPSKVL